MSIPVVHGMRYSVYTRIVLRTLAEKAVDSQFEQVDVFDEAGIPDAYLALNPFGKIPALVHGDVVLYETSAITRYIDEAFPGPSLQPDDPGLRARMNQLVAIMDAYAYRPLIWPVFVERISVPHDGGVADEAAIAAVLPAVRLCLDTLEAFLARRVSDSSTIRFFVGEKLSLADIHIFTMLLYFRQTPEGKEMLPSRVNLSHWLSIMLSRPGVENTLSKYGF